MAPKCKATTKAGNPCQWPAANKYTEGYCWAHDPGVPIEVRQANRTKPRVNLWKWKRKLRTYEDIIDWVEDLVGYMEKKIPPEAIIPEVVDTYASLAKIQLHAIKERDAKKASREKPLGFRVAT